jgi:hypothetical protein
MEIAHGEIPTSNILLRPGWYGQSLTRKVKRALAEAIIFRKVVTVIVILDLVFCTVFYSFRHNFQ